MKEYQDIVRADGSHYSVSQRKCPFLKFRKCLGEECALFSITGFIDDKKVKRDFGECALSKLPALLIGLKNALELKGN